MRIAVDASRTTAARVTGTEHYARELIHALIALNGSQNRGHHFTLYFRDAPPPDLFPPSEHVTHKVIPFRRLWTHLRFAAALWRDRPDVTFVPAHTLPFAFPGRAVVTVHDLGYKFFPQAHPTASRLYLDLTTRYSAARAAVVLADSAATARDLSAFYGTPSDKIHIVYPGVDAPHVGDVDAVRQKYNIPERYLLFIGTLQPRKNIARIVQAFQRYKSAHPESDLGLVLAGGQGWLYDPAWVEGVEDVTLTGYIDGADKGALYAGAQALIFPTLYEGFGFPVIEAMHCGTPVITSTTSSLPELVGDTDSVGDTVGNSVGNAAILVDPEDMQAIAAAIPRVLNTPHDAAALKSHAAKFTWASAARAAMDALEVAFGF